MKKFDILFEEIMDSLKPKEITEATDIASEQIVLDVIEDEILGNDIELKEDWKQHVSPIVTYVEENLPEDKTIKTIDYLDLVKLVQSALTEFGLFI
jgi:hypothetical protein